MRPPRPVLFAASVPPPPRRPMPPLGDGDSPDPDKSLLSMEQRFFLETTWREMSAWTREQLEDQLIRALALMMRKDAMIRKLGMQPPWTGA